MKQPVLKIAQLPRESSARPSGDSMENSGKKARQTMTQELLLNNRAVKARTLCLFWCWIPLLLVLCLASSMTLSGADLTLSYTDPVGDFTGTIDVTRMVVIFDNLTGNYKITLTSTAAQPFLGVFRV